jgi:hypothetical protein
MIKKFSFIFFVSIFILSCNGNSSKVCDDGCDKKTNLACKLTSPELQKRKATVIDSLKKVMLEKKELDNGYSFRFPGNDGMIDQLNDFIKTERQCCDFFTFQLKITGDTNSVWMDVTGPEGTKEFITTEMGF